MIKILTSNPGGQYKENGKRIPCRLSEKNHFLDNLKKYWHEDSRCIIISSDPSDYEINDSIRDILKKSIEISGLTLKECIVFDNRSDEKIIKELNKFHVIILAGGHVPTQNTFFKRINLKVHIKTFKGIVIGISAGSMNAANIVYAQPELEGESIDINYKRFIPGLGLTDIMIIPHYQDIKNEILDGKRVMEDIAYGDSYGNKFIALVDGSYIIIDEEKEILYGEGYLIENGNLIQINNREEMVELK